MKTTFQVELTLKELQAIIEVAQDFSRATQIVTHARLTRMSVSQDDPPRLVLEGDYEEMI